MRYMKSPSGSVHDSSGALDEKSWVDFLVAGGWTEVADAQGTPLNAASGSGQQPSPAYYTGWRGKDFYQDGVIISPPMPKRPTIDPAEQKLLDKVIKPFAGEALCDIRAHNEHLKAAPVLPWFDKGEDAVSHESRRKMKRWVSTNMRTWPLCNHSQQPLDLVFDGSYLPDGHGGQFCDPSFFCQYCDSKARRR